MCITWLAVKILTLLKSVVSKKKYKFEVPPVIIIRLEYLPIIIGRIRSSIHRYLAAIGLYHCKKAVFTLQSTQLQAHAVYKNVQHCGERKQHEPIRRINLSKLLAN